MLDDAAFYAANSLVSSGSAGLAPVIGGLCADFFARQKLSLVIRWESDVHAVSFETMRIEHWDFYFVMAAVVGLYSLHRLTLVEEAGEIDERRVIGELLGDVARSIRNVSSIAGMRFITDYPAHLLLRRPRRASCVWPIKKAVSAKPPRRLISAPRWPPLASRFY